MQKLFSEKELVNITEQMGLPLADGTTREIKILMDNVPNRTLLLFSVYNLGRMHGVRKERSRRKAKGVTA